MANELVHTDAGAQLTRTEDNAVGRHKFNNQATGDIMYASSATQLSRLAKGADNTILAMGATIPEWKTPATILADISPLTTRGDIMFRDATVSTRLAKGAANTVLVMGANDPAWSATLSGLTFVAPVLGAATATSINKLTLTQPATGATLTLVEGSSLITAGAYAVTLTATNTTGITLPTTGTLATLAGAETLTGKVSYNGLVITANTGVITTGTWSGTGIIVGKGGTGAATFTDGGLLVGAATSAIEALAVGLTTQILVGGGAGTNPAWGTDLPTAVTIGGAAITRVGGTDVVVADGGTGVSTFALNGILFGNAANAIGATAIGAAGQLLTVGADPFVPAWTTATFPATTTVNQLLYSSSANVVAGLATGNSMVLVTGAGGIPAFSATLPAITLGGTVTLNGQTFNAGAGSLTVNTTGALNGLEITCTNDGTQGVEFDIRHVSASPAVDDMLFYLRIGGKNSVAGDIVYATERAIITSATSTSEDSKWVWHLMNSGALNEAMTLSGAGGLAVDLDNGGTDYYVSLFDHLDDTLELQDAVMRNNRERFADIGVFDRKDTGTGYMLKVQPMFRFQAAAIYQTRALLNLMAEKLGLSMQSLIDELRRLPDSGWGQKQLEVG